MVPCRSITNHIAHAAPRALIIGEWECRQDGTGGKEKQRNDNTRPRAAI